MKRSQVEALGLRIATSLSLVCCAHSAVDGADRASPLTTPMAALRAQVRPAANQVPVGQPVWVRFTMENMTNTPVTIIVPGVEPGIPSPEIGLPLSHIFSGNENPSVVVTTETGRKWDAPLGYKAAEEAPILLIAPYGMVGVTVDLRKYFPALRGSGQFRIQWHPYGGATAADPAMVTIAPYKQVEIVTDDGSLMMRFFYDEAPNHVANFLELARSGFYSGKSFHRIAPGYLIQGGCPKGDGSGIRVDGKRVSLEPGSRSHVKGAIAMALLEDDPESASCQFFICNTDLRQWDGKYTVFAHLEGAESFATLDRLMATPTDDSGKPTRPLVIRQVRLTDAPIPSAIQP